jgi:DNA-binding NtrC family response regulator
MKTILLVNDDEAFRHATARHLTDAGYRVILAADSMAALDELSSDVTIDLLLTEVVMPKGKPHGFALARMARLRRRSLPIVLMTGYDDVVSEGDESLGPVLRKPIDMSALSDAIGKQLESPTVA